MSAWSEYKKKLGDTRPWDMFNPDAPRVDEAKYEERMNTCRACERFIKVTTQCKECGCIMSGKAKLEAATCPLAKW